ncbi:hypothetical protein FHT82_000968 [Rhizobium sp. BK275]|uniref:Uncharacterized protein n=1 Tax=Rhizobium viscosum TaxID=1673 RepID=A0ABR9IZK4_RHIVS|nr:hypothetical protein [Rhizobium sp. BK275]MBB3407602.1 hypothetical protein [Rhizobium sp. BK316]MBE1508647.1 hypothetical protein [Rhizobium viscosum]
MSGNNFRFWTPSEPSLAGQHQQRWWVEQPVAKLIAE